MPRGAVVIVENTDVLLIERVRAGRTYHLFPGGGVEMGETAEEAAVREAREELVLVVRLGPLVAIVEHEGSSQHYFLAYRIGGVFGTGDGPEMNSGAESPEGSYRPVRLPVADLHRYDVRPRALADALCAASPPNGSPVLQIMD